jgi:predicted Fe-S protein YdhL (DUF1289 family)
MILPLNDKTNLAQFPCVRNCCLNEANICLGCFRSLEEIVRWGLADDEERGLIMQKVRQRREEVNGVSGTIMP